MYSKLIQDNKSSLIWCQIVHCILFLTMGCLFVALFAKTKNDEACDENDGTGCNFMKLVAKDEPPVLTDYSV